MTKPNQESQPAAIETFDFPCAICGATSTRLVFVPPGCQHPKADSKAFEDLLIYDGRFVGEGGTLITESVTGKTSGGLTQERAEPILTALRSGDPLQLIRIDRDYLPSYCPECKASYCRSHWRTQVVFDEGFYDCTYGFCPAGHRKKLDD